jgi:predicted CXXCH cytochrome family protein
MLTAKLKSVVSGLFRTKKRGLLTVLIGILLVGMLAIAGTYHYIVSGGMIARQDPPALETFIASRLVNLSIPSEAKSMKNPLGANAGSADVAAGRILYQQNCETCHGYDGSGKTQAGGGLYPPPADLRGPDTIRRTDGSLFYLIRNGIRNTGMPGWKLTDQQTWQLVALLRNLPVVASNHPAHPAMNEGQPAAQYVGSAACSACHEEVYNRWKTTLMANVVRDPREHPEAIIPDLSKHDPLVTFTVDDIAFVYGSKWKQRYFKKVGNDYFPLPAQWDVTHKTWRPYFVKDDWWAAYYPPDNFKRPTGTTCDGCHSVNYDASTKLVTEWNVGCEKCHGPGSEHVKNPVASTIIDPARLDYVQATDTCIQCHSQGRTLTNPIAGNYYDWPVGFHMGLKLSDFWKLEEHKLGETTFTHFADGTAHKNRMQGNDFVTSLMYSHGVSCFTCHDSHGSSNDALLRKPANVLCLDCHGPKSPNGPRTSTIEQHTHHKPGSAGSECIACHMPKVAQTLGDVNVRSHTFRFVSPAKTDALKIPNACNVCHTEKSTAWTADALKSWSERSPWRMRD